jgi:hypothetical protein
MGTWRYVVNTLSSCSIWGSRLDSEAKTPYMMQSTRRSTNFHIESDLRSKGKSSLSWMQSSRSSRTSKDW